MLFTSSTKANQHVWLPIDPRWVSNSDCFKNAAFVKMPNYFVAHRVGKWSWLAFDLYNLAESRYAPIKEEAFSVADALGKARHFVLGCDNLIVVVDHKSLLGIFYNRSLENIRNNRF